MSVTKKCTFPLIFWVPRGKLEGVFLKEVSMGLVYAPLTLSNPREAALRPISVSALVDTGALHLCLPPHVDRKSVV